MNKDSLLEKRAAAETKFNELQEQKTQIETESIKLQGDWRTYNALIEDIEFSEKAFKPETKPEANTIVIEPKRSKKNAK